MKEQDIKKANNVLLNKLIKIHNPSKKRRRHSMKPLTSQSFAQKIDLKGHYVEQLTDVLEVNFEDGAATEH